MARGTTRRPIGAAGDGAISRETIRDIVRRANAEFPGAVFKPGYPAGRGVYMVLDRDRAGALDLLRRMGVEAAREPCGHDWNYKGDLYRLRRAGRPEEAS